MNKKKCDTNGRGKFKTKYRTRQDAERAIAFIWGNDPNVNLGDLHTYLCPKCHTIHIGHRAKKRAQPNLQLQKENMS